MDLPLALTGILLFLLAAPPAAVLVAFYIHERRRLRRKPRQFPTPEPAAAALEPRAPAAEEEPAEECGEDKRRRRRAKRRQQQKGGGDGAASAGGGHEALLQRPRFPLASVAGSLQRRITAGYDDLARASQSQSLTIDQVDKLESEHERLKKDAAVYNYLQEQLQLSAPYKLMMELNDLLEKEAREHALATDEQEISFEELLAQEEDAAFWWRDGKLRSISGK